MPAVGEDRAQFTLAVPPDARVTLVGHDARMVDGNVAARLMLPARPKRLVRVICSVFGDPALKDIADGPDMVKSEIVMLRATLWVREPLVPVMVRV